MADGSSKPIDQIKIGDKVADAAPKGAGETHSVDKVIVTTADHDFAALTIGPARTGKTSGSPNAPTPSRSQPKSSLRTMVAGGVLAAAVALTGAHGPATQLADLNLAPTSAASLTTTFHHAFYDATTNEWTQAENLRTGDLLQTPTGYAQLEDVHLYHASTTTYDLTIGDLHTYYVVAGSTPVLVHNCGGSIDGHSTKCNCANGDDPRIPPNPAGRRGNAATQAQLNDVRDEFLAANPDWVHYAGGTDAVTGDALPEEAIFGPNGERRFPDLSFRLPDGSPFYVNTVDTLSDGVTADPRELANAIDINMWGQGPVAMIPKSR